MKASSLISLDFCNLRLFILHLWASCLGAFCNAPVAILLFLVDFNMFGVFLYENVELCEY